VWPGQLRSPGVKWTLWGLGGWAAGIWCLKEALGLGWHTTGLLLSVSKRERDRERGREGETET
jgi:hypothetical protein